MMRLTAMWIFLQVKSSFKRVSFWLMVCLCTLVLILTDRVSSQTQAERVIYVCTNDARSGQYVYEQLVQDGPAGYVFALCDDENEIADMVARSEAVCGIVFEAEADDIIPEVLGITEVPAGMMKTSDVKPVRIYQSPGYPEGYFTEEIVFPLLQRYYSDVWFEKYLPGETQDFAVSRYDSLLEQMDLNLVQVISYNITDDIQNERPISYDLSAQRQKEATLLKRLVFAALAALTVVLTAVDLSRTDAGFYAMFGPGRRAVLKLGGIIAGLVPVWIIATAVYLLYLNLII